MRYTEYHSDKAVIKDKTKISEAMEKLAKVEDLEDKHTDIDRITTEMMEHICDSVCKHSNNAMLLQEELDGFCAECKMGKFVCDILNTHNRLKRTCKTGDKVYQVDSADNVYEHKITKIIYDTDGIAFDERAIGKTVFLTEQEAQAALEKMKAE